MIKKQQLKAELDRFLEEKPKTWRKGQAIFNIDSFIDKCVELINEQN